VLFLTGSEHTGKKPTIYQLLALLKIKLLHKPLLG